MVDKLVQAIKSKKGLENLDDDFVQHKIEKIFSSDARIKKKFYESNNFEQFRRSKEYENLLKAIRKNLRTIYGVFQEGKREDSKSVEELLETHTSTKERLPYYEEIYRKLSEIISSVNKIIDLGCGMNPLSYKYMPWKSEILASDISEKDMEFLEKCFSEMKIPGKTLKLDLVKDYEKLKKLKGDVTFMFKLLDSLEEASRHISYKIFENITTPWIVVSFSTKSLGGKKTISSAGRTWFERLLKRKNLEYEKFSVENELFYIIKQD